MYAYIKGTLEETGSGWIVIDNQGIGYQMQVSARLMEELPMIGTEVKIYTYLNVKEDAMSLFGFLSKDDLHIFKLLLAVNGLAVLSVLSADDLRFAVVGGDAKAIAKAPGIGAKTAQRVILELKDKLNIEDVFEKADQTADIPVKAADQTAKNEAIQALTALGYSASEALSAVSKLEITEDMDTENILKAALKQMAFL